MQASRPFARSDRVGARATCSSGAVSGTGRSRMVGEEFAEASDFLVDFVGERFCHSTFEPPERPTELELVRVSHLCDGVIDRHAVEGPDEVEDEPAGLAWPDRVSTPPPWTDRISCWLRSAFRGAVSVLRLKTGTSRRGPRTASRIGRRCRRCRRATRSPPAW